MTPTLQLPASDEAINRMVAEHVAGWTDVRPMVRWPARFYGMRPNHSTGRRHRLASYHSDAGAVIELLEQWRRADPSNRMIALNHMDRYVIELRGQIGGPFAGISPNFCTAGILALLKAAGVRVVEEAGR